jgi:hypothetical protein
LIPPPAKQEAKLATPSKEAQERAELNFKKKEIQARDASKAMAEYEAGLRAEREKTARLKLLREAKEAADAAAKATAKTVSDTGAKEAADAKASKVAAKKALEKKAPEPKAAAAIKKPVKKRVLAKAE